MTKTLEEQIEEALLRLEYQQLEMVYARTEFKDGKEYIYCTLRPKNEAAPAKAV